MPNSLDTNSFNIIQYYIRHINNFSEILLYSKKFFLNIFCILYYFRFIYINI